MCDACHRVSAEARQKSQPFPRNGALGSNLNLALEKLRSKIPHSDNSIVYSYVVRTIDLDRDGFTQWGSAPNFQGDLLTLCTCKHYMRTLRQDWKDIWVAGVTTKVNRNALVYLMKVMKQFESQSELWSWMKRAVPRAVHQKAACWWELGDLFLPKLQHALNDLEKFVPANYVEPCELHSHSKKAWYRDIDYRNGKRVEGRRRRPLLLVGDPKLSFIWDGRPSRLLRLKHPDPAKFFVRGQKKWRLQRAVDYPCFLCSIRPA